MCFLWVRNEAELLFYFVCDCGRGLFRSLVEVFFFCRDRDRLFSFDFTGLSFVVSLLISSAFPCLPVMDRGRAECGCRFAVVVGQPRWFGTGRRLTAWNLFLLEAPRGPLVC